MEPGECRAGGFVAGFAYDTVAVNPTLYCAWLLRQCERRGLKKQNLRVRSLWEVFDAVPGAHMVVDCAGVGAGQLAGDEACFPTKGQTVLVRGQASKIATRRNLSGPEPWEALVIPRPGEDVTLLGGCKLVGDWSTDPNEVITATILERCKALAPELLNESGEFEVLDVRVGLRPRWNNQINQVLFPMTQRRRIYQAYLFI